MQKTKPPGKVIGAKFPPSSSTPPTRTPAPLPRTKPTPEPPSLVISDPTGSKPPGKVIGAKFPPSSSTPPTRTPAPLPRTKPTPEPPSLVISDPTGSKPPGKVIGAKFPPSSSTPPTRTPAPLPRTKPTPEPPSLVISDPTGRNVSSKFKNIISKSLLIHSGPPAVYQLQTKKEDLGPLTRLTLGKKNLNKANRTVLLVGETGAGKSTVINSLVNHAMGVKFEDEVWFQIVKDEKKGQTESQTSDVIVYEVFGFEDQTLPFSLTIIDTPGFGDTRGIERDLIVSQRLFDLFRSDDGINEIHAGGLVVKATDNRVNDRLSYVFNSVMSLFGKNLEKSIVALVTHSDGRTPKNVLQALAATNIKCAKNEKNQPIYFLFDNSQTDDRSEDIEFLKIATEISEKGMKAFTAFLEKKSSQKLITTTDVLNERISLAACIQNLHERILLTEQKQQELKQTHDALVKQVEDMKKSETVTVEVDVVYKEKELLKSKKLFGRGFFEKAMVCTICEENCHYPGCTISSSPQHCEVIKKGRCTVCTKKCPASAHVKENWRYVIKTKKAKKTVEVKKEKQVEKVDPDIKFNILKSLANKIQNLKAEKIQLVNESYQHVITLEEIALKVDSVSTFVHLDFLIEKMKETGDMKKVQRLEEMRSRMDEGTKLALQYMWGRTIGTM